MASRRGYTQLKIEPEVASKAKAVAQLVGEEYYAFVQTAITERIERLKKEGRLKL